MSRAKFNALFSNLSRDFRNHLCEQELRELLCEYEYRIVDEANAATSREALAAFAEQADIINYVNMAFDGDRATIAAFHNAASYLRNAYNV